ncbi:MAG: M1 family metallopeptidase [Bacteroidota bacterium]
MQNFMIRFRFSLIGVLLGVLFLPLAGQAQQSLDAPVKASNAHLDEQSQRPIPYPILYSPGFKQAVENGTRTLSGQPGANYWTNDATYTIHATLSPSTQTLRARALIEYTNNSPDTLQNLALHLRQNFYQKGNVRNRNTDITGGMNVSRVAVDGQDLVEGANFRSGNYFIDNTRLLINRAQAPVAPGQSATVEISWNFKVPQENGSRMGQDGEVFYLGYWYPQMAMYDDVNGWMAQPYMGNGEFYMGFADYDVSITVPEGWLVAATGQLKNSEEVLTDTVRRRLDQAATSDSTIHIVSEDERVAGKSTVDSDTGQLTWRFTAEQVRDFAFGTSDHYVWDATNAQTGEGSSMIHALYRPQHKTWEESAQYGKFSIEYMSDLIMPYPWPQMSIVEGLIGGGMEYPMITLIGSTRSARGVFGVTFHELSHMWFPMMVGSNEKAYTWMDEGLVSFNTKLASQEYWNSEDEWNPQRQSYYYIAGSGQEVASIRHADRYPVNSSARYIASYNKPALVLNMLRGIVGEEAFMNAYRTYAQNWKYKHPTPYDLFHTFETELNMELDWFWRTTIYETWLLDQAITQVESGAESGAIQITDLGLSPMPVLLTVTYADGSTHEEQLAVDHWLKGNRTQNVQVPGGEITKVEIDPHYYMMDVDRSNNMWRKEADPNQE